MNNLRLRKRFLENQICLPLQRHFNYSNDLSFQQRFQKVMGLRNRCGEHNDKACLVTESDKAIDKISLLNYCAEYMPRFAVPRFIVALNTLQKYTTRKIQKELLRQDGVTTTTLDRKSVNYKIARRI